MVKSRRLKQMTADDSENMEEEEHILIAGGSANGKSHSRNSRGVPSKSWKAHLLLFQAVPLTHIYPKDSTSYYMDTSSSMFTIVYS